MTTRSKPRHYRIRNGIARWEATAAMRAHGFKSRTLGPDCCNAREIAEQLNRQWDVARRGHKASDETIVAAGYAPTQTDEVRAYETLRSMDALAERFATSNAAKYLAKGMRSIARKLDRAAQSARANSISRDILHVTSA